MINLILSCIFIVGILSSRNTHIQKLDGLVQHVFKAVVIIPVLYIVISGINHLIRPFVCQVILHILIGLYADFPVIHIHQVNSAAFSVVDGVALVYIEIIGIFGGCLPFGIVDGQHHEIHIIRI